MIIFAKLSDIFGRKLMILSALALFCISSGACGAAPTSGQLWVITSIHQYSIGIIKENHRISFRAFQGIGGSGVYAMTFVILPAMVPTEEYALHCTIVSSTFIFSFVLGPLFGGLINNHSTWRWIFLLM